MPAAERVLVLSDGGLVAYLACAVAAEARAGSREPGAAVMALWPGTVLPDTARGAAARQAGALGLPLLDAPAPSGAPTHGQREASDLLASAYAGARAGFGTVVWTARGVTPAGIDLDAAARIVDRAILIARVVALDAAEHGLAGFTIETPYVDLSDAQAADLAGEMGLDVALCAWDGPERARWEAAFAGAGWPLAARP